MASGPERGGSDRGPTEALAETAQAAAGVGEAGLGVTTTEASAGRVVSGGTDGKLAAGTLLDRYRVERVLGEGGMGVVYAALDADLDRVVAIKVLSRRGDDEARARLLREARAMARIKHPNVITVYEVGTVGAVDFVAMELVDGETLAQWLGRGPHPAREVVRVFAAAGRGLEAAHRAGLVHRDFKPSNVLVEAGGRVLVTDFGLARAAEVVSGSSDGEAGSSSDIGSGSTWRPSADAEASLADASLLAAGSPAVPALIETALAGTTPSGVATADTKAGSGGTGSGGRRTGSVSSPLPDLTRTGAVLGTPAYMAPEQHLGRPVDPRTDQFSFCIALHEALSGGHRPFAGSSLAELRAAVTSGRITPPPTALPSALRGVVSRGLSVQPDRRYPAMSALLADLERWLGRGRRRLVAAAVALLAMALLVTAAVSIQARRAAEATVSGPGPAAPASQTASTPAAPTDPALRAAVAAVETALAEAARLSDRGEHIAARRAAEEAVSRARGTAWKPIEAAALLELGRVLRAAHLQDEARGILEEAVSAADAAADDGRRAAAVVAMAELATDSSSDRAAVREQIRRARTAVGRLAAPAVLSARLDVAEARVGTGEGDVEGARRLYEAALAVFTDPVAGEPGLAIEARDNLASLFERQQDWTSARRERERILAEIVGRHGSDTPAAAEVRELLASDVWLLGDLAGASALQRQAASYWKRDLTEFASRSAWHSRPTATRTVRGRVLTAGGAPAAGVTVAAGATLTNDDTGMKPALLIIQRDGGPVEGTSDAEGRFELAGVNAAAISVIADGGSAGWSWPVAVPEGAADSIATVTLRLRAVGGVRGVGTDLAAVQLVPVGFPLSVGFGAPTDRDGRFHFDRLPPGEYVAMYLARSAVTVGGMRHGQSHVIVRAGQVTTVTVPAETAQIDLEVVVRGESAGPMPTAQVLVVEGTVAARDGRSLMAAVTGAGRWYFTGFAAPIQPGDRTEAGAKVYEPDDIHLVLRGLPRDPATLCVIPLGGDVRDVEFTSRLMRHLADLALVCQPLDLSSTKSGSVVVVSTPPMRRLPPSAR